MTEISSGREAIAQIAAAETNLSNSSACSELAVRWFFLKLPTNNTPLLNLLAPIAREAGSAGRRPSRIWG